MFLCKKLRPFTFVILRILLQNSIFLSGQRDASFILTSTASINPLYLPFLPTNTWWYPPVHSLSLSPFFTFLGPSSLPFRFLSPYLHLFLCYSGDGPRLPPLSTGPALSQPSPRRAPPRSRAQTKAARRRPSRREQDGAASTDPATTPAPRGAGERRGVRWPASG
jgi:hypothetical protein